MHRRPDCICVRTAGIYYLDHPVRDKPESSVWRLGYSRLIQVPGVGVGAIKCVESLDIDFALWGLLPGCYVGGRNIQQSTSRVKPQRARIIKDGGVDDGTRQPVSGVHNTYASILQSLNSVISRCPQGVLVINEEVIGKRLA